MSAKLLPLLEKIVLFVEVTQAQREHHLQPHANLRADSMFSDADMTEIHQDWMKEFKSWMHTETQETYENSSAAFGGQLPSEHIK